MNMKHPFLEQTYFNIAIFNRTLKRFSDSLLMWKRLENLQKDLYGEKSPVLYFTWKNVGTCYLGVGQSEQAKKYFEDCLQLLKDCPVDEEKVDVIQKDKEEEASLNQNLYLVNVADRNYEAALKQSEICITLLGEIYGTRSKKLAGKHYQKANCCLFLQRKDEAIESIEKAIDIHNNPEPDKEQKDNAAEKLLQPEKELGFNRIQYQSFLCSALFM